MAEGDIVLVNEDWKRNLIIGGAILGAILGVGTAYLMIRTAEEDNSSGPPQINTRDLLKIGVNLIGTMRGIAALGSGQ